MPLLVQGTAGLDKMGKKAEETGNVLGNKLTKDGAKAALVIKDLKAQFTGAFNHAVAENASEIAALGKAFGDFGGIALDIVGDAIAGFVKLGEVIGVAIARLQGYETADGAFGLPATKTLKELLDLREKLTKSYTDDLSLGLNDAILAKKTSDYNRRRAALDKQIAEARKHEPADQVMGTQTVTADSLPPKASPKTHPSNAVIGFDPTNIDWLLTRIREQNLAKLDTLRLDDFGKGPSVELGSTVATIPDSGSASIKDLEDQQAKLLDTNKKVTENLSEMQRIGQQAVASIADGFVEAIAQGENLGDVFKSLVADISKLIFKQIILNAVKTGLTGTSLGDALGFTASANGNVFGQHGLVPFAKGGIVNSPTLFKFANGTGLMGEAGPEAILPLARGPGGKLGVRSASGGVVVNVHNTSQAKATAQSRRGPDGQHVIDVMVEDSFNRLLGSGRLDKSLAANVGVRRPGRF